MDACLFRPFLLQQTNRLIHARNIEAAAAQKNFNGYAPSSGIVVIYFSIAVAFATRSWTMQGSDAEIARAVTYGSTSAS